MSEVAPATRAGRMHTIQEVEEDEPEAFEELPNRMDYFMGLLQKVDLFGGRIEVRTDKTKSGKKNDSFINHGIGGLMSLLTYFLMAYFIIFKWSDFT